MIPCGFSVQANYSDIDEMNTWEGKRSR